MEPSEYYPLVITRFLGWLEVLSGLNAATTRNILTVDARDTLFQGDPFSQHWLPAPKESEHTPGTQLPYVLFTEEGDTVEPALMRNDPWDLAWVRLHRQLATSG